MTLTGRSDNNTNLVSVQSRCSLQTAFAETGLLTIALIRNCMFATESPAVGRAAVCRIEYLCKSDAIGAAMNSFWAIWCRAATFATERRDLDMWGRIAATSTKISYWIYKVVPTIIYNVLPSLKCGWWGQASACKWVGSRVGGAESPFRTIQISS